MPHFVLDKIQGALNEQSKPLRNSHVHILGVAYKRNIDDVRESPALDIIHLLSRRGAQVTYSDPRVHRLQLDGGAEYLAEEPLAACSRADCAVIVTDHSEFDYAAIVDRSMLIVDTRNVLKGFRSAKIVRL
jgi:UDP-N-acetyl-D-glucosamine dehydrogenase